MAPRVCPAGGDVCATLRQNNVALLRVQDVLFSDRRTAANLTLWHRSCETIAEVDLADLGNGTFTIQLDQLRRRGLHSLQLQVDGVDTTSISLFVEEGYVN